MRWLSVPLFLLLLVLLALSFTPFTACNSSSGNECAAAGGTCTLGSCTPYCLNGACSSPLPTSAQDCPSTLTNSAGQQTSGNPCCVTQTETDSGAPVEPEDSGGGVDATLADSTTTADATAPADATEAKDGAHDAESEAETGTLICSLDGGDGGAGMCLPDGGDEDSGALDAGSDG